MDAESFGSTTGHQAMHIVPLVPEEREHQHWHSVADPLVDTVSSSVSHEHFDFGMTCGEEKGDGNTAEFFGKFILDVIHRVNGSNAGLYESVRGNLPRRSFCGSHFISLTFLGASAGTGPVYLHRT